MTCTVHVHVWLRLVDSHNSSRYCIDLSMNYFYIYPMNEYRLGMYTLTT